METVITVATVPAIVALTNLVKSLGISGKWSALVAVLLGIGLSVADYALAGTGWWDAASGGLLLGLAAAGLYDLAPSAGEQPRRAVED
ncbi:MAG: hypothetical protein E7L06_08490 [Schaalia turicensis]|nr:hypothetical protein [Schaalia turicensis]